MQICVPDHVELHPQKKKEVLYFVKKTLGEIGESRLSRVGWFSRPLAFRSLDYP